MIDKAIYGQRDSCLVNRLGLGFVDIHFRASKAARKWIMAAKLVSVLS